MTKHIHVHIGKKKTLDVDLDDPLFTLVKNNAPGFFKSVADHITRSNSPKEISSDLRAVIRACQSYLQDLSKVK